MKKRSHFWSSPEFWLFSSFFCALAGVIVMLVGVVRHDSTLKTTGLFLTSPFLLCMTVVTFVLIPTSLYGKWKRKKGGTP